jgi:flagellar biogenesis protein FliO
MMGTVLKMMLFMGSLMLILYFGVCLFKRLYGAKRNMLADGGIKILSSKLIAPQKYVSLIEIAGEVLALGVTPQQVTFLTKIENKERLIGHLPASSAQVEIFSGLKSWFLRQRGIKGGIS